MPERSAVPFIRGSLDKLVHPLWHQSPEIPAPGRGRCWLFENICSLLRQQMKHYPSDFGYQRSRWSTELMAIKIREIIGCHLHASTVRHWLPRVGLVWRRAAPTLRIRASHKEDNMAVINQRCSCEVPPRKPGVYEEEVDIHLNPKIDANWQLKGQQKRVVKKYYRRVPCTAAPGRSATWAAAVKVRCCLSAC